MGSINRADQNLSFVSKFIEATPFKNKLSSSFLLIGVPLYIIFSLYLYLRHHLIKISTIEVIFVYIALSWAWIGPYLISHYEKKALSSVKKALLDFIDSKQLVDFFQKYERPLHKSHKGIIIIWVIFITFAYYLSRTYVVNIGFHSYRDFMYLFTYPFVAFLAFLTALGFVGIIKTFRIMYAIYKNINLKISCYNPDGIGGLTRFFRFTKTTTYMFASGSLFVPILITVASSLLPSSKIFIYSLISIFTLSIVFTNVIPNWLIYKKAKINKTQLLQQIYTKIKTVNTSNATTVEKKICYDDYHYLRKLLYDTKNCSIAPFKFKYLFAVFIYVMLPITMTILQIILSDYFGAK